MNKNENKIFNNTKENLNVAYETFISDPFSKVKRMRFLNAYLRFVSVIENENCTLDDDNFQKDENQLIFKHSKR